jgi:hypothetical protein
LGRAKTRTNSRRMSDGVLLIPWLRYLSSAFIPLPNGRFRGCFCLQAMGITSLPYLSPAAGWPTIQSLIISPWGFAKQRNRISSAIFTTKCRAEACTVRSLWSTDSCIPTRTRPIRQTLPTSAGDCITAKVEGIWNSRLRLKKTKKTRK